jgi:hypothetical protein
MLLALQLQQRKYPPNNFERVIYGHANINKKHYRLLATRSTTLWYWLVVVLIKYWQTLTWTHSKWMWRSRHTTQGKETPQEPSGDHRLAQQYEQPVLVSKAFRVKAPEKLTVEFAWNSRVDFVLRQLQRTSKRVSKARERFAESNTMNTRSNMTCQSVLVPIHRTSEWHT